MTFEQLEKLKFLELIAAFRDRLNRLVLKLCTVSDVEFLELRRSPWSMLP